MTNTVICCNLAKFFPKSGTGNSPDVVVMSLPHYSLAGFIALVLERCDSAIAVLTRVHHFDFYFEWSRVLNGSPMGTFIIS
jgi:hypothetical protein